MHFVKEVNEHCIKVGKAAVDDTSLSDELYYQIGSAIGAAESSGEYRGRIEGADQVYKKLLYLFKNLMARI